MPAAPLDVTAVGLGVTGVDRTEVVGDARVEQQALGEAGLTGVDVRDDADGRARGADRRALSADRGAGLCCMEDFLENRDPG